MKTLFLVSTILFSSISAFSSTIPMTPENMSSYKKALYSVAYRQGNFSCDDQNINFYAYVFAIVAKSQTGTISDDPNAPSMEFQMKIFGSTINRRVSVWASADITQIDRITIDTIKTVKANTGNIQNPIWTDKEVVSSTIICSANYQK